MNGIDRNRIRQIAALARLDFDEKQETAMAEEFAGIIAMVDKLSQAEVDGVEPFINAGAGENIFRDDRERASLDRQKGLANAPEQAGGFFKVPDVI